MHTLEDLRKMNAIEQHIICKDNEKVIAYLLAMTIHSKNDLPVLFPMFEEFNKVIYKDKPLSSYNYVIVGQVCVDKDYRGQGILDECYEEYKRVFKGKYDFAITEISARNMRSIKAHLRIGFKEIHRYNSPDKEEWSIVIWEW
jgi:GNAT superfamily N-acetyltransferase